MMANLFSGAPPTQEEPEKKPESTVGVSEPAKTPSAESQEPSGKKQSDGEQTDHRELKRQPVRDSIRATKKMPDGSSQKLPEAEKAAKERAEERIAEKDESLDIVRAEFALRKALTRIHVAGYK